MLMLNHFSRISVRKRYRSYRVAHTVFSLSFFVCFLLGVVLATAFYMSARGIDVAESFRLHWFSRASSGLLSFAGYGYLSLLPFLLFAMVFGITIYGPLCAWLATLFSAFYCGAYFRFLLGVLWNEGRALSALCYVFTLVFPVFVLLSAFAFSAAVSLRVFTPRRAGVREEDQLFGGTLFCAPYLYGSINFRFLLSYFSTFLLYAAGLFLFCVLQAALVLKL